MPSVYNESRNYAASKQVVFKQTAAALNALGFRIKNSNEANGLIEAQRTSTFAVGVKKSRSPSHHPPQVHKST
jgi:hypothetical protein